MLKKMNLQSLSQAQQSLTGDGFKNFISYHEVKLKAGELDELTALVSLLIGYGCTTTDLENFFVGYTIPQIGKEFDLLRFGENFHINIELKSTSTDEKILKQLRRNKYYLSSLGQQIYHLTFRADTNSLYLLNNDETLSLIEWSALVNTLKAQELQTVEDVNTLFNPSNYLVSPFNSTERFLNGEYFLTNQQEDLQAQILNSLYNSTSANFISLTGGAGTGKTLLAYDIVKSVLGSGKQALVAHCGQLNEGQRKLVEAGWNITPIKNLTNHNLSEFDLILVDEAQRLYPWQIDHLSTQISSTNGNCLFAHDKLQTLAAHEEVVDASGKVSALCVGNSFSLSAKIRTNKEIANFIKSLLDINRNFPPSPNNNIMVRYFNTPNDVRSFLNHLDSDEWEVLRFTPSQKKAEFHQQYSQVNELTSHKVIGQEFDGVAVVIDQYFTYDANGKLVYGGGTYYSAAKMLFQNLTRARKRLLVVIQCNEQLLNRCMAIT